MLVTDTATVGITVPNLGHLPLASVLDLCQDHLASIEIIVGSKGAKGRENILSQFPVPWLNLSARSSQSRQPATKHV